MDGQRGHILTNEHVVSGQTRVGITMHDGETYNGEVLGVDATQDIAVVQICCGRFATLSFNDDRIGIGSEVISIGYALGIAGQPTVTTGVVSAIRSLRRSDVAVVQIDAAINPGSSGGPLLNRSGEVLGMNTLKIAGYDVDNVGFAIHRDFIRSRGPALTRRDSVAYEGRTFVRMAGPFGGTNVEGLLIQSGVRAQNFVAEVQVLGESLTGVVWTEEERIEGIVLARSRYQVITRKGDADWAIVDEGSVLPESGKLRVVAIAEDVWVYLDDVLVHRFEREIVSSSWIRFNLPDAKYSGLSVWGEFTPELIPTAILAPTPTPLPTTPTPTPPTPTTTVNSYFYADTADSGANACTYGLSRPHWLQPPYLLPPKPPRPRHLTPRRAHLRLRLFLHLPSH